MARTGPASPEAKAVVSMNAVRHGLRSPAVVIPGLELQSDWDLFLRDASDALQPVGAVEYALAERATTLLWRLRRVGRAERDAAVLVGKLRASNGDPEAGPLAGMIAWVRETLPESAEECAPARPRAPQAPAVLPAPDILQTLSKYEARLSRQLNHALHELQALQDRRQGRDAPLARVDVQGLPGDD